MTPFAQTVYAVVRNIPKGETMTYKQVAITTGRPKAYRAIGNILNKNHDPLIPCHRVINKSGDLGGFSGGAAMKRKLLKIEGRVW